MLLSIEDINAILVSIVTIIIVGCSITIVITIRFQKKQNKKYDECVRLIKEKEDGLLSIKNGLDESDIKKIDKRVNINKLMMDLYDIYLQFINKLNINNDKLDNILDDFIKEIYQNKINIYKSKNYLEVTDNIELVNYSILEYNKLKVKFRVNITCFNYKKRNQEIINGSNLERVEQITIITYVRKNKKWLINNIEKVYEKKLSI